MTVVVVLRYFTVIASEAKQSISRPKERIVGWVERSDTHRLATGIDGYRFAPPILRAVELQQLRLFRRDRIAGADGAARDHLGIDPAVGMAEPALQRLRDGEVALRRIRIDIDGGAADDALHDLQPDIANGERSVEQIEFVPGRPALNIKVGAEAQGMDRRTHHVLDGADAGEI